MSVLLNTTTEPNPLATQPAEPAIDAMLLRRPAPERAGPGQTGRPLVVVAEDRADERTLVGMVLGSLGFDVILAVDGLDALNAVLTHGPDAVVSDMDMPNLDGLGLCRALRALRTNETLPIIVYTGADGGDPRLRDARALHGAQVISKALAGTEVAAVLREMMTVADEPAGLPN